MNDIRQMMTTRKLSNGIQSIDRRKDKRAGSGKAIVYYDQIPTKANFYSLATGRFE